VDPAYIDEAFGLLKEVLTSNETMLEGKLIIINAMFIYAQGNQSGSIELNRARKVLEAKYATEIKAIISEVMDSGLEGYTPKAGVSIYDNEENFMYALYQMWSGDPADSKGIAMIREVAEYGLIDHPDVIGHYWKNRFPKFDNFVQNPELMIEVDKLIEITKQAGLTEEYKEYIDHWTNDLAKRKEALTPAGTNEGFTTVRMQLVRLGYILKQN
jgi:hypothetical protein